jgi:serine/threonine-protein kinase RsbW
MEPLIVPGILDSLGLIREYVKVAATHAGLDRKYSYRLQLAVDEIATNVINHGYLEAGKSGTVRISADLSPEALTVTLEDTATPFDPRELERPDHINRPLGEKPIGGLGVFLAIESVDEFRYEHIDGANRNVFVIRRPAS